MADTVFSQLTPKTYIPLSSEVLAVREGNRAKMLGTQEQVCPPPQITWHLGLWAAVAQLCDLGLPLPGLPDLYNGANSSCSPNRVVVKMR